MERWGDNNDKGPPGRTKRYVVDQDQPSFSSTLLDAIYKSMDDEPSDQQPTNKHYAYYYKASLSGSYRSTPRATTSSSSDCSSYAGFSSSEPESSHHRRLRPIRTTSLLDPTPPAPAPAPASDKKKKKKKAANANNIRAKLRDLRKPPSPGARLAGFLNAIFNGKRAPPSVAPPESSASCSTASSCYSRSCLSKTPSTRGQPKRTVRFMDSDADARRRVQVQVGVVELEQMLLHRMEMDSDEDDDDSSDASSDLFELHNLDELPVYETTRVVLNHRAIAHGHGHGRSSTRVL